jgi:hypothetical protein
MMDAVPDEQISEVTQFLQRALSETDGDRSLDDRLKIAWDAVGELAPRLDDPSRGSLVQIATDQPMWKGPNRCRPHMIKAVHRLVAFGIPHDAFEKTARASIPLAVTAKSDFDYTDAVNLLCQLAESDANAKQLIGDALFPTGNSKGSVVLAQVAPLFGRHVTDSDAVAADAARQVRLQVQRLSVDEEPQQTGYMTATSSRGNAKIATCLGAGDQALATIRRHKDSVSDSALADLIDAIVEMITDSDNLLGNRAALIQALCDFTDRFDAKMAGRVWSVLEPIAKGQFAESSVVMTTEEAQNPLSRVSMKGTTPAELRGIALVAVAEMGRHFPGECGQAASPLIDAALSGSDMEVRQLALASARNSSRLSPSVLAAVLLATQDSVPDVARVAWLVLAEYEGASIPDELAHSLVYAGRRAVQHPDPSVRCAAAAAMVNLEEKVPGKEQGTQIGGLRDAFARDICHSVRRRSESGA